MFMFCSFVNIKVAQRLCTQAIFGKHTFYYTVKQLISTVRFSHNTSRSLLTLTTRITRIRVINTVCPFFTGQLNLVGIDNNNIVTTIYMRSKIGFVLSAQQFCYFSAQTTQNLVSCVNYHPFFVGSLFVCRNGLVT